MRILIFIGFTGAFQINELVKNGKPENDYSVIMALGFAAFFDYLMSQYINQEDKTLYWKGAVS